MNADMSNDNRRAASTTAIRNDDDDDELEESTAIAMTTPTGPTKPVGSACFGVAITQAHKRSRLPA
jgi:nicotinamide mononucleotide (NMN) deamidase PncC